MEPTVVSGPSGRAQWDPEQTFPSGFQPDCGGVLGPSETGSAGLDFRKGDRGQGEGGDLSQTNAYSQGLAVNKNTEDFGDGSLSWLFSPTLTSALTPDPPSEESVSLSAPPSPFYASESNEPFLSVDSSDELCGMGSDLDAPTDLPPSQSRKTLSPETRDEGLFPDQVTESLGSSESRVSPGGAASLSDLEVPDFAAAVIGDVPPKERSDSPGPPGKHEPPSSTQPTDEDVHGDPTGEADSVGHDSVDSMEDRNVFIAKTQPDPEEMASDSCLTVGETHEEDVEGAERSQEPNQHPHHQAASPEARRGSEHSSASSGRQDDASSSKAVFDALDRDGDGFVRVEEFMEFAAAYGADQVKDLTKFLDPSGLGVISFEDFHRGISAISNGGPEPALYSYSPGDGAGGCPEDYDEQNEVTDSAYSGSESTYSECETFTDEDTGALVPPEMHEEVETDSGIEATSHDPEDGGSRFSSNSELHSHSLVTVISGEEEHFEDFGESNTSESSSETSVDGPMGEGDSPLTQPSEQLNGSSVVSPSTPAALPDCFQSFLREEASDFFCSQCHKQISRLEDLSTRLNFLESTSAGKRLSSKKVARHLLQNSSMTSDTMSDSTRDISELADNDITDKVSLSERRVAESEKESEASGEQHSRSRQENLQSVHRANASEEQSKEQESQAEEQSQQEARRHKEASSKSEREKGSESENVQARSQQSDDENSELRSCVPCLRANIERLEEEKRKLQDEVETMSDRSNEETESRRKMADKSSHERHQNQKEKESTQELIEDSRKQSEHLQSYKSEAEAKRGRSPGAGSQEYQTRTREAESEHEIKRLKQDNRTSKEQNDELNGQIINSSIQGAKNSMSASFSDSSAAEISSVSRAESMEAVHKQEEINYRSQDYIDKIIVAIMESNPSISEVK